VVLPAAALRRQCGRRSSRMRRQTHASILAAFRACEGMQREWSHGRPIPRSTDHGMAQVALRKWLSSWPLLTSRSRYARTVRKLHLNSSASFSVCLSVRFSGCFKRHQRDCFRTGSYPSCSSRLASLQGLAEQFHDMESIQDAHRQCQKLRDHVEVWPPHVATDKLHPVAD
jgi:hypothetical protein